MIPKTHKLELEGPMEIKSKGYIDVFHDFERFEDRDIPCPDEGILDESDPLMGHPDAPDCLELTRQGVREGEDPVVAFPLYNDSDLHFLDPDTEMGRKIGVSIVQADFDDDVATDEDM